MDGNLVRTLFKNHGEVANWPNQPSGEWPKGSGHSYVDGVPIIVQVETEDIHGNVIHPMETMYREFIDLSPELTPWGWAPVPGYFNPQQDQPALSDDPDTWPSFWPDRPPEWAGFWNGFFGKGIFNAQLEAYFVFDDDPDEEFDFFPDMNDPERRGIGVEVATRGFQWSNVLAEDNIFWLYEITNEGTTDYSKALYAQYIDWGVGGTDDSGDDSGSFDTRLDIAFAWDSDDRGTPGNWRPVGVAGYGFLESPGNASDGQDNDEDGMVDERRDDGIDNDGDWRPFSDLNDNGKWDDGEPLNDDVGADGVGPFDLQYTEPDQGEADGVPTPGEPNFDATDPDESDQIGLTGFSIFPVHFYELWNDEENWELFNQDLPPRNELLQSVNLGMFFSSGLFPLQAGQTESFSMALLFAEDQKDLVRTKKTVQQIFDADYRFAEPPLKATMTAVPGNGKVTLYWDEIAERSFDRFLQEHDFEGYNIYKATDPELLEPRIITDSFGNLTFRKPVAQFDLENGLTGPHLVDINGIKFNIGSDVGLRHVWTDTDVQNGQTYYYAVVAYDRGFIDTTAIGTVEGIPPSETTSIIKTDVLGNLVTTDINTARVVPNAPAAGYIPPDIPSPAGLIHFGPATGVIQPDLVDHRLIQDQNTYQVLFEDDSPFHVDVTPRFTVRNRTTGQVLMQDLEVVEFGQVSPFFDGLVVKFFNDTTVAIIDSLTGWLIGKSNYTVSVGFDGLFASRNVALPGDFELRFFDTVVDTSVRLLFGQKEIPTSFEIVNLTDQKTEDFLFFDVDTDELFSPGDRIVIAMGDSAGKPPVRGGFTTSWSINFSLDSTVTEPEPPQPGDVYQFRTTKPFRTGDTFEFAVTAQKFDQRKAATELERVVVVPNPYVIAASWEPPNRFRFGRGERRIAFIHLPPQCTIRIYTVRGQLVDTIEHDTMIDDGAETWDLVSKDGMDIAYGLYIFHVEAPGIGTKIGKFAVIK
ncbi:MAG: hypothetical protein ACE5IY_14240 [bacterium]